MGFPEWSYNPIYLPTLEELCNIKPDLKTGNFSKSDFIAHNPLGTPFQILNKEFINGISKSLEEIIDKINNDTINILEIGAGNGRLGYFLEKELNKKNISKDVHIILTDNFSWFTNEFEENSNGLIYLKKFNKINVENITIKNALKKYNPEIIISSWIPKNENWIEKFKENTNTKFFLLIGDPLDCGLEKDWKESNLFEKKLLNIEGNICWRDLGFEWENIKKGTSKSQSKVTLFIRK